MFEVEIFGGHLHHGYNVMGAGEMSLDGRGTGGGGETRARRGEYEGGRGE